MYNNLIILLKKFFCLIKRKKSALITIIAIIFFLLSGTVLYKTLGKPNNKVVQQKPTISLTDHNIKTTTINNTSPQAIGFNINDETEYPNKELNLSYKTSINPEPDIISNSSEEENLLPIADKDITDSKSIEVEAAYAKDGKKTAFFTFDDGPSRNVTPELLKILKNYNIKATFFVVGAFAGYNKDILKEEYADGHSIGNHSYTHDYKILYQNTNNFTKEITETNDLLHKILGDKFKSRLCRLPGGGLTSDRRIYKDTANSLGFACIDWNCITGDSDGINIPSEKLFNTFKSTAANKDHLVILMHDSSGKETTVQVLPTIIEYLKNQGYEFDTLK